MNLLEWERYREQNHITRRECRASCVSAKGILNAFESERSKVWISRSYERVSGRVAEHSHAAGERRGIEPQAGILIRQFSRFARPKMYITPSRAMRLSSIRSTIGNRPCSVPDQEIGHTFP
jgi:hypothetical protein